MSGTPTPVNMNDRLELAARIFWLIENDTRGATEQTITQDWNDPCDRENAMRDMMTALSAYLDAKNWMPAHEPGSADLYMEPRTTP